MWVQCVVVCAVLVQLLNLFCHFFVSNVCFTISLFFGYAATGGSAKFQDMQAMQMQMQMGMGAQPGAQFDAKKEYTNERDAFRVSQHINFAEAAERRLVGMEKKD